jgi:HKD family nuclease
MLRIILSNVSTVDQLARSIVIMATQIIIIIMFLSDDTLSVLTDNLLKDKKDYEINLKLLHDNVITLN